MLSSTEEAQTRALIAQNAAILSLAASEPAIISKLAATKVSLADLTPAVALDDSDLFLVRQGLGEKSVSTAVLKTGVLADLSESSGASLVGGGAQVASSIAALRELLKTSPSSKAFVTGYYADGDGGGGSYYYDSADTTSADNTGTIIVASDGGRWKLSHTGEVSVKQFGAKSDCIGFAGTDNATIINAAAAAAASQGFKLVIPNGRYLMASLNAIIDGYTSEWYFVRLWDNLHIVMEHGAQLVAASGLVAANAAAQGAKGFEFFSDAKTAASVWTIEGGELDHNPQNNLIPVANGWGSQVTTPSILLHGVGGRGGVVRRVWFNGNPGHNSVKNEEHDDLLVEHCRFTDFASSIAGNSLVTDHSAVYSRGKRTIARFNDVSCVNMMYRGSGFELHGDGSRAYHNTTDGVAAPFLCASYRAGVTPTIHINNNTATRAMMAVSFDVADTLGLTAHVRDNNITLTGLPYDRADPLGRATHDAFTMRQGSNYNTGAIKLYIDDNTVRQETPIGWVFADDIVNCPFKFHKTLEVKARRNKFYGFKGAICDYGVMLNDLGTFEFSNQYYNCGSASAVVAHTFMNDGSVVNGNRPLSVTIDDEFIDCGYTFVAAGYMLSAGILFWPYTFSAKVKSNTYMAVYTGTAPQAGTIAFFDAQYKCLATPSYAATLANYSNITGNVSLDVLATNERHGWGKLIGLDWKYKGGGYLYAGAPAAKINPFGDVAGDRVMTTNYTATEPTSMVCKVSGVGPGFVGTWANVGVIP